MNHVEESGENNHIESQENLVKLKESCWILWEKDGSCEKACKKNVEKKKKPNQSYIYIYKKM